MAVGAQVLASVQEMVKDREAWCAAGYGVAKSWTRLSDWTKYKFYGRDACGWMASQRRLGLHWATCPSALSQNARVPHWTLGGGQVLVGMPEPGSLLGGGIMQARHRASRGCSSQESAFRASLQEHRVWGAHRWEPPAAPGCTCGSETPRAAPR